MKRCLLCLVCIAMVLSCVAGLAEPLKKGSKGDEVQKLQLELIEHNYLTGSADGDFGGQTEKAIKQVQADAGLEQTGIADDATLEYLSSHYATYEAKKDSDILFFNLDYNTLMQMLRIHIKNTGRQRITSVKFKLYQCNSSKTSLGTFYGKRNTRSREYWTEHVRDVDISTGENQTITEMLAEGKTTQFSDGTSTQITYFDKGTVARVIVSQYTTEDGKTHNVNQRLYCNFR